MTDSMKFSMAWRQAGYREKYAMEHGRLFSWKDARGHQMWKFNYSTDEEYQDANGATFDITEGVWVG